jgi:hypothetical protein
MINKFNSFLESEGMCNVVSATVGSLPGVPDGSGSGDIGLTLNTYSKVPVSTFSSDPSKVSDLRYLKKPKINKIKKVKDL